MEAETCMAGRLEDWPLGEIILWLNQAGRTATVRVGAGLDAGVLLIRAGQLFRCEWGGLFGVEAFMGLLALSDGPFVLMSRVVESAHANVTVPTAELLLQCTVAMDERQRRSA